MKFHVIIPVFNRLSLTLQCLQGLAAQEDQGMRILLVDDGSSDGTSDAVHAKFPQVEILEGTGELFWTGSVNLGIRQALASAASDDYILLLNNDTVHAPDFIRNCRTLAGRYPQTLIGSVILKGPQNGVLDGPQNGVIKSGGTTINWYTAKHTGLNGGRNINEFPSGHMELVSTLTGRGVIIPVEVYRRIGLYDERHFRQCGDTELPRRAYLNGYSLYVGYDLRTYDTGFDRHGINFAETYSLKDLKRYFFDIRSHAHLKTRFWISIKTATNPFQAVCFLFFDLARITTHFLLKLRMKKNPNP